MSYIIGIFLVIIDICLVFSVVHKYDKVHNIVREKYNYFLSVTIVVIYNLLYVILYSLYEINVITILNLCCLSVISVSLISDLRYNMVPDRVNIIIFVCAIVSIIYKIKLHNTEILFMNIVFVLLIGTIVIIMDKILERKDLSVDDFIGGGDIKLFLSLGLILNPMYIILAIWGTCVLLVVYHLINKNKNTGAPLMPSFSISLLFVSFITQVYKF